MATIPNQLFLHHLLGTSVRMLYLHPRATLIILVIHLPTVSTEPIYTVAATMSEFYLDANKRIYWTLFIIFFSYLKLMLNKA